MPLEDRVLAVLGPLTTSLFIIMLRALLLTVKSKGTRSGSSCSAFRISVPTLDLVLASSSDWSAGFPRDVTPQTVGSFVPLLQLEIETVRIMLRPFGED